MNLLLIIILSVMWFSAGFLVCYFLLKNQRNPRPEELSMTGWELLKSRDADGINHNCPADWSCNNNCIFNTAHNCGGMSKDVRWAKLFKFVEKSPNKRYALRHLKRFLTGDMPFEKYKRFK